MLIREMRKLNEPYLSSVSSLPSFRVSLHFGRYSLTVPLRVGHWVGQVVDYIPKWFSCLKTVTHFNTNWVWCRVTLLIHPVLLPLTMLAPTETMTVSLSLVVVCLKGCLAQWNPTWLLIVHAAQLCWLWLLIFYATSWNLAQSNQWKHQQVVVYKYAGSMM